MVKRLAQHLFLIFNENIPERLFTRVPKSCLTKQQDRHLWMAFLFVFANLNVLKLIFLMFDTIYLPLC